MKVIDKGNGQVDLVATPVTVAPSAFLLANAFDTYVQQGETVDWSSDVELDMGNPDCTATQPDGWINADVDTLVQSWASGKATRGHRRHQGVEAGQLREQHGQSAQAVRHLPLPPLRRHGPAGRSAVQVLRGRVGGQHDDLDPAGHRQ